MHFNCFVAHSTEIPAIIICWFCLNCLDVGYLFHELLFQVGSVVIRVFKRQKNSKTSTVRWNHVLSLLIVIFSLRYLEGFSWGQTTTNSELHRKRREAVAWRSSSSRWSIRNLLSSLSWRPSLSQYNCRRSLSYLKQTSQHSQKLWKSAKPALVGWFWFWALNINLILLNFRPSSRDGSGRFQLSGAPTSRHLFHPQSCDT